MLRNSSIEIPLGFLTSSCNCGIKKSLPDLALFYSEYPSRCAGVFTKNCVKSAHVLLCSHLLKGGTFRGIIVNSGNANALTGKEGIRDIERIIKRAKEALNAKNKILMASTGVIGIRLPVEKILSKIDFLVKNLSRTEESFINSAKAIMTTDSFYKIRSKRIEVKNGSFSILGIAKGAGMICPSMATMLCFIFTDAFASNSFLKKELKFAVENSFNRITVDGDMSTNDSVFIFANGASKVSAEEAKNSFREALLEICSGLAEDIVRDGEGATKIFSVSVKGAKNDRDAKKVVYSVGNSLLVKTAIYGGEPNFGRIAAAAGASGVRFDPFKLTVKVNGEILIKNGKMIGEFKKDILSQKRIDFEITIGKGRGKAFILSSDLSPKYVELNSGYMS